MSDDPKTNTMAKEIAAAVKSEIAAAVKSEIAAEVKSELQQVLKKELQRVLKREIQHALNNIDRQINKDLSEIKSRMRLQEDTLTMLGTQRLAQASGAGPYVPEPRGVGPTARYLTEPRSRWKPTWFYSH